MIDVSGISEVVSIVLSRKSANLGTKDQIHDRLRFLYGQYLSMWSGIGCFFFPKKNCISGTRFADLTELEAPFDNVAKVQEYLMEHLPVECLPANMRSVDALAD